MLDVIAYMVFVSGLLTLGIMTLLWIWSTVNENAGVVDIGWALCFLVTAITAFALGDGYWLRKVLFTILIFIWSIRLGSYLLVRFYHHNEDPRYLAYREKWTSHRDLKFFGLFIFQGLLVIIISIPFHVIAINPWPHMSTLEWTAAGVFLLAVIGETISDFQLQEFKETAPDGAVCDLGLWNWTRHPNYFFEWLVWFAVAFFALASPLGWMGLISWGIMSWLLIWFSGVPLSEEQNLKSKPEAYKEYQSRVSMFFPWPPKK